jgi:hypothetical protein
MSVSELEQAELVQSERRMAITSFACDIVSANEKQAATQQTFVFRAPLTSNLPA